MIAGPRLADGRTQRVGYRGAGEHGRRAVRVRHAPGERSRSARGRRASVAPARRAEVRGRRRADRGREPLGADHRRRRGPELVGHLGGVRRARHRRAVPDRRRPAPRLPRRGARHDGRSRTWIAWSSSRSSSDRSSRSRTRSFRRRRSWRRTGTSPRGRGATSGSGRSEARPASRSPTGRSSRAWRWPRAAIWGSRRSTSSTRRWAGCWRRATDAVRVVRRERAAGPLQVPEGVAPSRSRTRCWSTRAASRSAPHELKAALEDEPFLEIHPNDAAPRGVTDGGAVRPCAPRPGRPSFRCASREHVVEGAVFVPFNQPGFAANTILPGVVLDRRDGRAGRRAGTRVRDGRRPRRWMPDGLARLAPADRTGRRGVLRAPDLRAALRVDGAQGDRRHADAEGTDARRAARHPDHARGRHQAVLQGRHHAHERRPARLRDRARTGDLPGVPGVRGDPVRHAGHALGPDRARSSWRTWTSASCGSWR